MTRTIRHNRGAFLEPLSKEDEKKTTDAYFNGDDDEKKRAKDALVEHNMRLVAHIAKKYGVNENEDLISIGTIVSFRLA